MTEKKEKKMSPKSSGTGKANIYSLKGESVGTVELNPGVFNRSDVKPSVVHQVVNAMLANSRNTVASTKDRGAVRGGGKKPWKQKGTGRARAGSIRSPLWRGGGVTFGPTADRNFSKKINKRDRKLALIAVLSDRASEGNLVVIEKIEVEPKTRAAVKLIADIKSKLDKSEGGTLLLTAEKNDNLVIAVRNLPSTVVRQITDFSILDVLRTGSVVIEKEALSLLEQNLLKEKA